MALCWRVLLMPVMLMPVMCHVGELWPLQKVYAVVLCVQSLLQMCHKELLLMRLWWHLMIEPLHGTN